MSVTYGNFTVNNFSALVKQTNGVFFKDNLNSRLGLKNTTLPMQVKRVFTSCGETYFYDGQFVYNSALETVCSEPLSSVHHVFDFYFGKSKSTVICDSLCCTVISQDRISLLNESCAMYFNDTFFGSKDYSIGVGNVLQGDTGYPYQTLNIKTQDGKIDYLIALDGYLYAFTKKAIYALTKNSVGEITLKKLPFSVNEIATSSVVSTGEKILFFADGFLYELAKESIKKITNFFNRKFKSVNFADYFNGMFVASVVCEESEQTFIYDNHLGYHDYQKLQQIL